MKYIILPLLLISSLMDYSQADQFHIDLQPDEKNTTYFDPKYKPDVLKAFQLANFIFNSKAFQEEIRSVHLDYNSYCPQHRQPGRSGQISGEEILKRLFKEKQVLIAMHLKKSGGALGETSDSSYHTTAWHDNIVADMPELPFAYGLAVNLCHEYMHQVGFCHLYCTAWICKGNRLKEPKGGKEPDPVFFNKDVTYRVGWIAYYHILKNSTISESH